MDRQGTPLFKLQASCLYPFFHACTSSSKSGALGIKLATVVAFVGRVVAVVLAGLCTAYSSAKSGSALSVVVLGVLAFTGHSYEAVWTSRQNAMSSLTVVCAIAAACFCVCVAFFVAICILETGITARWSSGVGAFTSTVSVLYFLHAMRKAKASCAAEDATLADDGI